MHLYCREFSTFDTIYIGGGTPSLLSPEKIEQLLNNVARCFNIVPQAEVTLEANPCDITLAKARLFKKIGINRISLGIQSFDSSVLKFLGRRHSSEKALTAISDCRQAGFDNISIDLLYGIPGQKLTTWQRCLTRAADLEPEHISCYQLTVKCNTPLWHRINTGTLTMPTDDKQAAFFYATAALLEKRGYRHYEISNFARSCRLFSAHNMKYWHHAPYLGLGPSAHSFRDSMRWWNCPSTDRYCNTLARGGRPVAGREKLTDEQLRLETLFLRLRTREGISLRTLKSYSTPEKMLTRLVQDNMLRIHDDRAIPTTKGFLLADSIPLLLV